MINKKLRNVIREFCPDAVFFADDMDDSAIFNTSFDNSIIGISDDGSVVYIYDKMIQEYMEENNCSFYEAQEWIDYNTIGSLYGCNIIGVKPTILYTNLVDDFKDDEDGMKK